MSDYIERYWRDATPADAIKEPPMVARFRDRGKVKWTEVPLRLMGLCRASCVWSDTDGYTFHHCQVYDAPDPGEGWRLIDTENEEPQEGDEIYDPTSRQWIKRSYPFTSWVKSLNRRRIEPPKPKYVPFTWEDREQLRGRWVCCVDAPKKEWAINSVYIGGGGELRANGIPADLLLKQWTFTDTGEPVGRRVQ